MSLTLSIPASPTFVKDDINITVTTLTTGVIAHYIVLSVIIEGKTYALKHPVINGQASFNIADIINSKVDFTFDENVVVITKKTLFKIWSCFAYEIYNYDGENYNLTPESVSQISFVGSSLNYSSTIFLTNYRERRINRNEFLLLFFNFPYEAPAPINVALKITYSDNTVQDYITEITNPGLIQFYIKPENYPIDAKYMTIEIPNMSEVILVYIDDIPEIDKQTIIYRNSFGVYETISLLAHRTETVEYEFEQFESKLNKQKFNVTKTQKTEKATFLLNKQFQNDSEAALLFDELFMSEDVFLYENNILIPIIITDTKRIVEDTQNQNYRISINYEKNRKNA